ncbi:putative RNA polymerase II subunit B1 CTD phosphatase RPAP, partial [Ananas comosus]
AIYNGSNTLETPNLDSAPSSPPPPPPPPPPLLQTPMAASASAATVAAAVHRIQLALLDGAARSEGHLLAAGALLSRADYEDVVIERTIAGLCGHPLCPNPLPSDRPRRGRFRVALREHRVYDLEETYKYCSQRCVVASRAFSAALAPERSADLSPSRVEKVLALFADAVEEKDQAAGLGKEGDLGFSKLTITEKDDAGGGDVSLDEWIGPSNAIEGYVPQYDSKKGLKAKANAKEKGVKKAEKSIGSEVGFTSTGFVGDEVDGVSSWSIRTQDISEGIAKKLEDMALEEKKIKKQKTTKSSSKSSKPKQTKKASGSKSSEVDFTSVIIVGNETSTKTPNFGQIDAKQLDVRSAVIAGNQTSVASSKAPLIGSQYHEELGNGIDSREKKIPALRSSLKTKGSKTRRNSVKWADEVTTASGMERKGTHEGSTNSHVSSEGDDGDSLRLASAEACAAALTWAAEAVTSGTSEVEDAVSEAGIVLLPQPQHVDGRGGEEGEDNFEFDRGVVKWPKKTVILDTDMFEVEDSWHDTPPEGFSLTLSSFATLWMALFGWITCSSLAYVYGCDESAEEDFLMVNGREYPRKIVLKDDRSSEIRQTIDGCVSRALLGLVMSLRLPVPVSTLEKNLGLLLDTMSFVEALPSFKTRQWQVIVLLFLDALSAHRLPALAPHMTNKNMLLHKVLNAAQVSGEEYDSMRDLLLPMGRSPDLS